MDPSLQLLLTRLEQLSEQFREVREGMQKAMLVAELDPEMALTRARKVLEYVIRDVYQHRINEPPGTRPLENLLQRLVKDGFFPNRLDAYANTIRKLGNVGTHTFGEKITVADVYQSLSQLSYILEWYFEQERPEALAGLPAPERPPIPVTPPEPSAPAAPGTPVAVVPKGLRSFDAKDADFFLDLLPGPRDRDGLPESIRFWKHRIEERDEPTFTVGVIYGPSGCGKSSLVKAGLLPRLAKRVLPVYVEATADDTEARLLKGLRKRCASLAGDLDLTGTMATLRQGGGLSNGQKVLIVVDQFEQWSHGRRGEERTELAQALRQCDGEHVQCVVIVRDDFWMATTRFMSELHIELLQGQNIAPVDLFDPIHARNVLTAFGRAFERLPCDLSRDQESFLDQAIAGLSQDGRVICVRLSLFAEMMKGKSWTPATLKDVGGTEGVGATFLEETFSVATAPPKHRYHQKAARAVLKALLPEAGSDIKGHMRSQADLLAASGYANRPRDFDDLLRILDSELRLITPTDLEGADDRGDKRPACPPEQPASEPLAATGVSDRYYQLTHDYLVPSLRDWLTRKQKETRRGRAELLLADRAGVWNARPENRQLPSLSQWVSIRLLTRKKDWTPPQRKMMRQAGRYHVVRGLAVVVTLLLLLGAGWEVHGRLRAQALMDNLLRAPTEDVPAVVRDMGSYRRWLDGPLHQAYAEAEANSDARKQLHASLALLPVDPGRVTYLKDRLLHGTPEEVLVIRQALLEHRQNLTDGFWELLENASADPDQRFRAACALAAFAPDDARWDKVSADVAGKLVAQKPFEIARWTANLKPEANSLLPHLAAFLEDEKRSGAERGLIATVYSSYAVDVPEAYASLEQRLADESAPDAPAEKKLELTKKQANIGVGLLAMDRGEKVWLLLKHSADPTLRSFLIERLGPGGVDARLLLKRLDVEKEDSIRRAILLSLGEFGPDRLPPVERQNLLSRMLALYRNDPDPGIHGAARWLLKQWRAEKQIKEIDEASRVASAPGENRGWSVNSQGQTMVFIAKPREGLFWMGEGNARHQQPLGHDFAMSLEDVTVEQFLQFCKENRREYIYTKKYAPTKDCPAIEVSWYEAAEYCNWLSQREGIAKAQWCYEPNKDDKYAEGMKIKVGYLRLKGYRLPTEAEWEYACRAGSEVGYSFGEPAELLDKYGWFDRNSLGKTHSCGKLKPNDLGLFDMHGNVWQWTQSVYNNKNLWQLMRSVYNNEPVDKEDDGGELVAGRASNRVNRGGDWSFDAGRCRAAIRSGLSPDYQIINIGFRLARVAVEAGGK